MSNKQLIGFVSIITIVFMLFMLRYFYKNKMEKAFEENGNRVNLAGLLVFVVCVGGAVFWVMKG